MNAIFGFLLLLAVAIALLCVCVGIYLLVKRYVGAIVQIKVPVFGEIQTAQTGSVLIFFGLFLFWFSTNSFSQARKAEELKTQLDTVMITTARTLRDEFRGIRDSHTPPSPPELFNHINFLIDVLSQIDSDNGHAIYFKAEVKLAEGKSLKEVRPEFFRYIEVQDSLPERERGGETGEIIIYQRPRGYARQRSGWIHNALANDFYTEAMAEMDPATKLLFLEKARNQVAASLLDFPSGFVQRVYPGTLIPLVPTKILQQNLEKQIEASKAKQ
jgi:hypothetical protein